MKQITSSFVLYKFIFYSLLNISTFTMVVINSGCSKEEPVNKPLTPLLLPPPPPAPPRPIYQPTPVSVWVEENRHIAWPADSCMLKAYAVNGSYIWRKISGPAGYHIYDSTRLQTKVDKLEVGEYEFEIRVTDYSSATARDTMFVQVIKPVAGEVIFKKLKWICPMGCYVGINNIYSFVPQNKPLSVFVRPSNSGAGWTQAATTAQWASGNDFAYEIDNASNFLYVYTYDSDVNVDVKIIY